MALRPLALLAALSLPLIANTPGGGPSGGGADVTLTDQGSTVTLANGTITAVITKDNAKINSILFNGVQCVRPGGNIYYSMDGGSNYRQPSSCAYSVTANTTDMVDISMRQTWSTQAQPLDIEIHYVLRRGDTGIYTYAILDHPDTYPAGGYGEWRMVWKLPNDTFENLFVDELRNRQMPTADDYAGASSTSIAEIVHLNSGILAGQDEGKYCYSTRYYETPTWGHASNTNNTGVWLVLGAHDYFNDGPFKQDLAPADRILHVHFGMNHYNGSNISIEAGENWRKLYGPYLLYCNTDPSGADACWQDAQAQVKAERGAWPYDWLTGNPDYPLASGRATVSGTLDLNDPLKPMLDAEGAWVGLAAPDPGGNFQFESEGYQHWVKAGPGGTFTIPHVRPGTYTLYSVVEGEAGEFEHSTQVTVTAGRILKLGTLVWNIPRSGSWLAWEIGLPDRDSREFFHGNDFWVPFRYHNFDNEFPNPLTYDVSSSVASSDWNYAQSGYLPDGGNISGWPWQVQFDLSTVPPSGTARLHIAFAGSNYARMNVDVNGSNPIPSPGFFYINNSRGNALLRQSSHAKYAYHTIDIPVSLLSSGNNTITITQAKIDDISMHAMYDYVALEMPSLPGGNPADGDGDGLTDAWETEHFLTLSLNANEDPDADTYTNAQEEIGGSDPNDPISLPSHDADRDGINDYWELQYYPVLESAAPLDDTDADGFSTWTEWKAGTSPTDSRSKPGISIESSDMEPVADTFIAHRSGNGANSTNFGTSTDLDTHQQGDIFMSAYIRFDLSSLPSGSSINSAALSFTKLTTNTLEPGYPLVSTRNDTLVPGRFASYGLLDLPGNTDQAWSETSLTYDKVGAELVATSGIQFDTTNRVTSFDELNESITDNVASLEASGSDALVLFLQDRIDSQSMRGLSTFIVDFPASSSASGRGIAYASREAPQDSRPKLLIEYSTGIPLPNPDEDSDGLNDAWEAQHFGTLEPLADGDRDSDETPEWLEQALTTDPNNANERFRATLGRGEPGNFSLSWPNGNGVTFTVESSATLTGPWRTESTLPGSESPTTLKHQITIDQSRRFFRVVAVRR